MTETRALLSDYAAEGDRLVGYCAVWDTPTRIEKGRRPFTEVIRRGAFARTLASGQDVIATFNHDTGRLLGRLSSGTLRLSEDARGLRYELDLPASAADIAELVRRRDLAGGSFSFTVRPGGDRWEGDRHELLDVNLIEVAPVVVLPAYPSTTVAIRGQQIYRQKINWYERT